MKFLYGLGGANVPVIREFDIASDEKIEKGNVLKLTADGQAGKDVIGNVLGVAAEDHSGTSDILNARSNGTKIRVDITAGGVYSVPAIRFKAASGSTTYVNTENEDIASGVENCRIMLVSKGEHSENTDAVGTIRKITSFTTEMGISKLGVSAGGKISEGDEFILVPFAGFTGYAKNHGNAFTVSPSDTRLTVVGCNEECAYLEVMLCDKQFN